MPGRRAAARSGRMPGGNRVFRGEQTGRGRRGNPVARSSARPPPPHAAQPATAAIRGKGAPAVPESTGHAAASVTKTEMPKTAMPETKSLIAPGSGRAVKAYIESIIRLKPQVQETSKFYTAMMASFGFPTPSGHNALRGPPALGGLVASMPYSQSCGNKAAKLLALSAVETAGSSIESAHLPTSQRALRMIASLDRDRMEDACNAAFHACTDDSRRRGMVPEMPRACRTGTTRPTTGRRATSRSL